MVHCMDPHGHTALPSVLHYLAKGAASHVRVPSKVPLEDENFKSD